MLKKHSDTMYVYMYILHVYVCVDGGCNLWDFHANCYIWLHDHTTPVYVLIHMLIFKPPPGCQLHLPCTLLP